MVSRVFESVAVTFACDQPTKTTRIAMSRCFRSAEILILLLASLSSCVAIKNRPSSHDDSTRGVVNSNASCVDRPLAVRHRDADVILSGIVLRLDREHRVRHDAEHAPTWRARVRVKRVIKGVDIIARLADSDVISGSSSVWIVGIGDPAICASMVRLQDTRIFLSKLSRDGELRLNSSVIRVTLGNLDLVDSVVHSEFPALLDYSVYKVTF